MFRGLIIIILLTEFQGIFPILYDAIKVHKVKLYTCQYEP